MVGEPAVGKYKRKINKQTNERKQRPNHWNRTA